MSRADHEFTRSFTCTQDSYTDLPSILIAFLISRDYLEDDFEEWYMGGGLILKIKENAKKLPVFCKNRHGGYICSKQFKVAFI